MKFKTPIEVQAGISDGDPTNPLGQAGYLLSSDGSQVSWISPSGLSSETAEAIVQPIKANEALAKGDPVYIVGYNNGQDVNIVAKADSSDVAKMPVVGIVDDDYASQAFGTMTAFGSFNGAFDTTGGTENWAIGDIIFVKPGGGLTNIKPTGTDLIQNIAIVSRVQQNTGELEVIALGRTNDVPNLPVGRLFVGTNDNTSLTSDVVYVDDTNDRVGIGTTSPATKLEVVGVTTSLGFRTDTTNTNFSLISRDSAGNSPLYVQSANSAANQWIARFNYGSAIANGGDNVLTIAKDNSYFLNTNVGIGTTSPNGKLEVNGIVKIGNVTTGLSMNGSSATEFLISGADTGENAWNSIHIKADGNDGLFIEKDTNNVGIGTTNPSQKLTVEGNIELGTGGYIYGDTTTSYLRLNTAVGSLLGYSNAYIGLGPSFVYNVGGSEKFRISSANGNVGIGTTSPNAKLQVNSGGSGNVASFQSQATAINEYTGITLHTQVIGNDDWYGSEIRSINTGGTPSFLNPRLGFFTQDLGTYLPVDRTEKLSILGNGNVGIGTTSPSEKLEVDGNVKISGDLTVNGGDIILGGTGRIQGIDTVSAGTDAANKAYVDNAVAGVPQGDITAVTAGTGLTGGGTSGSVTLNVANNTYTPFDNIRSLGAPAFTNGANPNITTAQVMAEIEYDGGFDSYSSVFKTPWSYAGNYNLTDAGDFTETAGSSWITWTDNSSDTTRGNITTLAIAPNSGGSAGGVFIYNDQGSGYSPGWRQVWTSMTDGAGSGLDADLLDGQQGSYYFQTNITGNAGSATVLQTARTIAGVSFSGSANISLNNNAITNGAGYTTNVGDITSVTGGTNLNGSGTSGAVTLNLDAAIELTSVQYGSGVTLSESSDRSDLLYVRSSTSSWGGLQIGNTSNEFIFSLMGDGSTGGIYDDQNSDWIIQWAENNAVRLYYNAAQKFQTTSTGVAITGAASATGTISAPKFYVPTLPATTTWAFHARNSSNTADSGIHFDSGSGEVLLRNSSNSLTGRLRSNGSSYFNGGNLGIGTTSPLEKLEVQGTIYATPISYASNQNAYVFKMGANNNTAFDQGIKIKSTSGGVSYMSFNSRNEDTLVLRNANVGIGTADPQATLHIDNPQTSSNNIGVILEGAQGGYSTIGMKVNIANYGEGIRFVRTSIYNGNALKFFNNTSQVGSVFVNTSSTSYNTTSDYRSKENVVPMENSINRLKELKPCRFNFIIEPENTVDGFIAHEAQEVVPESVTGEKDKLDFEGNPEYQGIDQSKIVPLLTAALQEAIDKIEQLETRIQTLENN